MALSSLRKDETARYLDRLRGDPGELALLGRDLLIHVTGFFRDPQVYAALAGTVIPGLLDAQAPGGSGDGTGDKAAGLVARLDDALGAMAGMLDTLLDLNQIEAGVVQADVADCRIGPLLDRLRAEFMLLAQAKGLVLRVAPCSATLQEVARQGCLHLNKPVKPDDLVQLVQDLLLASSAFVASPMPAAAGSIAALTRRQRDVMAMVLAGHPSKNIAADLGISQRTVENHRAAIMHKTGTRSLPELARLALAVETAKPARQAPAATRTDHGDGAGI